MWEWLLRVKEMRAEREDNPLFPLADLEAMRITDDPSRSGVEGEILRDIRRTFPTWPQFSVNDSRGQRMLACILQELVSGLPEIGYPSSTTTDT